MVCRAANVPSDERCARCGRRVHLASPRPAPLEFQPAPESQPALFREPLQGGAKIIPIPTLTPFRPPEVEPRKTRPRSQAAPRSRKATNQQVLEFPDTGTISSGNDSLLHEETIVCDAPVAPPMHRMIAVAVDTGLLSTAVVGFLAAFYLTGGRLVLDRQTLPLLLGIAVVIAFFYRCVWCIAGTDTPGMRFAGLRLVDFDGRTPDRDQRTIRQVAGLLSVVSAGLGLVWALVDEESLTWHDRISKTFPTANL